ncbi:MAG: M1 family peptidase, partial [Ginsengibacter sp.]
MFHKRLLTIVMVFFSVALWAQGPVSLYDHHDLFSPNFYPSSVNEYRTSDGQPGPKYWTNISNYKIEATLDDVNDAVSGSVTITYINNSPKPMDFVWLYLDQNLYRLDSRGQAKT